MLLNSGWSYLGKAEEHHVADNLNFIRIV